MALLTIENIESYIGRQFSNAETPRVELLLDLAIGEIEAYLGRPVGETQFTEEVEIDEGGRVFLDNTPVISVESVSVNGDTVDEDYWKPTKWGLQYMSNYHGTYDPVMIGNNYYGELITVEYTAGFNHRAINSLLLFGVLEKLKDPSLTAVESSSSSSSGGNCFPFDENGDMIHVPDNDFGGVVKRVRVEDFEVEYESASSNSVKMYASQASSLLIFPSDLDFLSIKKFRRVRTA